MSKKLSKKEIVSILQLLIAALSVYIFIILTFSSFYPFDIWVFFAQCTFFNTAVICLLFGLGTWFYLSNFHETRVQVRGFSTIVLWVLFVQVAFVSVMLMATYSGDMVMGFELEIWEDSTLFNFAQAYILGFLVSGIMLFMNIFLTILLIFKRKHRADSMT